MLKEPTTGRRRIEIRNCTWPSYGHPNPETRVEVITSCLRSKIETNFVPTASFAMGIADTLCPLSCAPAQPLARPFIGHALDTDREVYTKSLKSLAQVIATGLAETDVDDSRRHDERLRYDRERHLSRWPRFQGIPLPRRHHLGARGVRRFYLVTLLRGDEPTDWLGWPRPLPHSIQDQRQARQECEAIRHEFHKASAGQDRPSPAIPTNARSP